MHFTLLVAGALLPRELAVALTNSLDTPHLKKRLARASVTEQPAKAPVADNAHLDWLGIKLFGTTPPMPTAPYAYAQLAGAAAAQFVAYADPVHVEVARDHLIVQSLGGQVPSAEDTAQLITAANELAPATGDELVALGPHWFLRSERDWLIEAAPLAAIMETGFAMPAGRDAPIWNRWHNEIQMTWHAHPVNVSREIEGTPAINAVWLHGGGRWQRLPPIQFSEVHSDAPEWRGAADAAGARGLPLNANVSDSALIVIDQALTPRRSEDWTGWLQALSAVDQMLGAHVDASIDIVMCGNTTRTFESRPRDRYKPWRRTTMAEAFAE